MPARRTFGAALAAVATLAVFAALPTGAAAQSWPQKPVRFIVPGAAGGPTDVPARVVAEGLAPLLGQRVVVENRTGAGGVLAGEAVVRAAPDGYTMLYANSSVMAMNPALYTNMSYDPATNLVPVGMVTNSPQILVANTKLPYKDAKEMIEWAKANPGKLNFASGGTGTLPHLTYELLRLESGIAAVHVPYNGGAPALAAVLAGQADVLFDLIRTRVKSGELRALALTGTARDPDLPDVPTIGEMGFPSVASTSWTGVAAPVGTPREVISIMNAKLNELIRQPEFQAKLRSFGVVPQGGTPEEFAQWAAHERAKWSRVVKASGATAN